MGTRPWFISGQVSIAPDGLLKGRLGEDLTLEQGQQAARLCAINLIALYGIDETPDRERRYNTAGGEVLFGIGAVRNLGGAVAG